MNIFSKKPKITFRPIIQGLELIEPIVYAKDANPDWVAKKTSQEFSIKVCPGIRDYLDNGFIIKMWQDYNFDIKDQGIAIDPSNPMTDQNNNNFYNVQLHGEELFAGVKFIENQLPFTLKIQIPWYMSSNIDMEVLMVSPAFNNDFRWQCVQGILKPYKYHNLLLQLAINSNAKFPFTIKKGTPIAHLIPLAKDVSFEIKPITKEFESRLNIINNWIFSKNHSMTQYNTLSKLNIPDQDNK